jgi:hypothetical protein
MAVSMRINRKARPEAEGARELSPGLNGAKIRNVWEV